MNKEILIKNNKNKNDFTFEILVKAPDNSKVQVYNDETPIEDNTNNNINTINKNKNNGGGIANSFLNKIFKKDSKKYDTDSSFNSEKSDISINNINNNSVSQPIINKNIIFSKKPNNLAINNVTPLPDDDNYYKKNTIKIKMS